MDERLFKRLATLAFAGWILSLGVGASHLAVEALFPPFEAPPVDGRPADFRDAPAPSPEPFPIPVSRQIPKAAPVSLLEPAPKEAPADAAASVEAPLAPRYAAAGPVGRLAAASWGTGASSVSGAVSPMTGTQVRTQSRAAVAASAAAAPPDRARVSAARSVGSPLPSGVDAPREAPASGRTNSVPAGRPLALAPFPGTGTGARLVFKPAEVLSSGGRLGQGTMSMESGGGATLQDFDPKAKGLETVESKTPPGPSLKAGNAPAIPSKQVPIIVSAAREAGIDPALLAATAARESHFGETAYRAEPHLKQVLWGKTPGGAKERYYDGSIGPTQVLRSNFIARGITNDRDAYDLENNYRISAGIIKGNLKAFPGNEWKAVAAYNVGQYGAKIGRIPAGGYTETVLAWRKAYQKALQPYTGQ